MNYEEIALALIAEGNRRRNNELTPEEEAQEIGYGVYGDGLSREENDQWREAADFVRDLETLRPHSNPDSNHLDLS